MPTMTIEPPSTIFTNNGLAKNGETFVFPSRTYDLYICFSSSPKNCLYIDDVKWTALQFQFCQITFLLFYLWLGIFHSTHDWLLHFTAPLQYSCVINSSRCRSPTCSVFIYYFFSHLLITAILCFIRNSIL